MRIISMLCTHFQMTGSKGLIWHLQTWDAGKISAGVIKPRMALNMRKARGFDSQSFSSSYLEPLHFFFVYLRVHMKIT